MSNLTKKFISVNWCQSTKDHFEWKEMSFWGLAQLVTTVFSFSALDKSHNFNSQLKKTRTNVDHHSRVLHFSIILLGLHVFSKIVYPKTELIVNIYFSSNNLSGFKKTRTLVKNQHTQNLFFKGNFLCIRIFQISFYNSQ